MLGSLAVLLAGCSSGSPHAAPRAGRPAATSPTAPTPSVGTPVSAGPTYYLSLGDSLAFGYQQKAVAAAATAGTYSPTAFPGYTYDLAGRLKRLQPQLHTVDYGCPGETTATFTAGGCPFRTRGLALHDGYDGAQLGAALRFLAAHRGRVSLVTLSLGANDLAPLEQTCAVDVSCVQRRLPAVDAAVQRHLTDIVAKLHAAAPGVQLVVLELYNPAAVLLPATDLLLRHLDEAIAAAARTGGGVPADPFPRFNAQPGEQATLCSLTLFCSDGDVHPSTAGYHALADVIRAATTFG